MRAAAHGANFPMAQKVRNSMSLSQIGEFTGPTTGKPQHVKHERIHNLKHFAHPKKAK